MNSILSIGIILLSGFAASKIIRLVKLPSITAYLILGILIGPHMGNLVSKDLYEASGLVSNIVLSFIAFSIGQNFSIERFKEIGKTVLSISIAEGVGAAILVFLALYFLTDEPLFVALSFAAIAPATAPAAIVMIVREFRAKGRFTDTLLAVVALDDSWGLMIFALLLAVAKSLTGAHEAIIPVAASGVFHGVLEILGALVLGYVIGIVLADYSKYLNDSRQMLIYTLGFILFTAGLSMMLDVSVLLSNMAMATTLVNKNQTSFRFFNALRDIDSPFYILFFVLAGANLEFGLIRTMGTVGIIYVFARVLGKIAGVYISSRMVGAPDEVRRYLGLGLAPQAGVALGMAIIVKHVFPFEGSFIMSTIVATTVLYEIFGPILTKIALQTAKNIE